MDQQIENIKVGWNSFVDYLPQLAIGILLIVAAYIVARIVSFLIGKAIGATSYGKKLKDEGSDVSASLAQAGFWLTILFFLPSILNAFGLTQALYPVQNMVNGILTYAPRIIGALFVAGLGILVATIVRQAVTSLINATPVDTVSDRFGFGDVVKGDGLAKAVGLIAFLLVAVPVIIAALDVLAIDVISIPARQMLESILITIPNILGAAIILLIAFLVARLVKSFLQSVLPALGVDRVFSSIGFATTAEAMDAIDDKEQDLGGQGNLSASAVIGNIAMIAIIFFGITEAVSILNFATLSVILTKLMTVAGKILMGALVIFAGIYVARFVSNLLRQGGGEDNLLAMIAQYGIIILVTAMGLREMGLGEDIILIGFTLILAAAALAAGLAFGIGGRETAHKVLEEMRAKK